jgi:transketolase
MVPFAATHRFSAAIAIKIKEGTPMNLQHIAHTLRGLAMDGVQKANSGHPGMPLGAADFASVLFFKFLKHDPADPTWADRDRYVQSAGHGSMLLYGLLHLCGYDLSLDDLKQFRQWGSRTPGHPEYGHTAGVETTTGPLGQGCGNAVGMALAEAMLAERFNKPGHTLVDHYTYALCGDGDLMEGISHEAFSLAGHLGLHKLIVFYDCNRITIEGATDLAYSDDVRKRFEGYGWNVLEVNGHDLSALEQTLTLARSEKQRPTLIIGHTRIGFGCPELEGSSESHGSPLGEENVRATKRVLGLPEDQHFHISSEVTAAMAECRARWQMAHAAWKARFAAYAAAYPELASQWTAGQAGTLPDDLESKLPVFEAGKALATRAASGKTLQALAQAVPHLVGGSADLAPSTSTFLKDYPSIAPHSFGGRNLHFGIREHGMLAVINGLCLHRGFIPYGATFLVFADYCRPSLRLAAIMGQPAITVFTHDSIFLGEDGPTHQAVEHLASLRVIPHMTVIRPADANETVQAWLAALRHQTGPTCLILTRQNVPTVDRTICAPASGLQRGAYILWENGKNPDLVLIGTGSEVSLTLGAAQQLAQEGHAVRVVSMPSWEIFERQPAAYKESVLPAACARRIAVEAAASMGWERYVGAQGKVLGLDRYGASAPAATLAEKFGFTVARVVEEARRLLTHD